MKYLNLILLLICFNSYGQDWITDKDFDSKINEDFSAVLEDVIDACSRLENLNIRFSCDDKELLSLRKNIKHEDN